MPPDVTGEAFLAAVRGVLTKEEYANGRVRSAAGNGLKNSCGSMPPAASPCVTRFSHTYPAGCLSLPEPPLVLYCEGDSPFCPYRSSASRVPGASRRIWKSWRRNTRAALPASLPWSAVRRRAGTAPLCAARWKAAGRSCVLAEGSLVAGPACNLSLFARIRERGLLVSEFPPSFHAPVYRFSARNRIVAALSDVLLVVSAGSKSGTLITADLVHKLGRTVYAVPCSPGVAAGEGCNALLKEYAKCTDKLVDIAAAFGINLTETEPVPLSEREQSVLELLRGGPAHSAALSEKLGLQPQETIVLLTLLEMKGKVVSLGGNRYSLV